MPTNPPTAAPDAQFLELLQLRAEAERLRGENERLQRIITALFQADSNRCEQWGRELWLACWMDGLDQLCDQTGAREYQLRAALARAHEALRALLAAFKIAKDQVLKQPTGFFMEDIDVLIAARQQANDALRDPTTVTCPCDHPHGECLICGCPLLAFGGENQQQLVDSSEREAIVRQERERIAARLQERAALESRAVVAGVLEEEADALLRDPAVAGDTCSRCGGAKEVFVNQYAPVACPDCHGTGTVPAAGGETLPAPDPNANQREFICHNCRKSWRAYKDPVPMPPNRSRYEPKCYFCGSRNYHEVELSGGTVPAADGKRGEGK